MLKVRAAAKGSGERRTLGVRAWTIEKTGKAVKNPINPREEGGDILARSSISVRGPLASAGVLRAKSVRKTILPDRYLDK
jgi:hypothetical protein